MLLPTVLTQEPLRLSVQQYARVCGSAASRWVHDASCHVQALEIDGTLPLPLFGMAQLMSNQAGGVDKALANLEKALDKVTNTSLLLATALPSPRTKPHTSRGFKVEMRQPKLSYQCKQTVELAKASWAQAQTTAQPSACH